MITWMTARLTARAWLPAVVGAVAVAGPAFMLGQCSGVEIQKDRQVVAQVPTVKAVGLANTAAAGERVVQNHTITAAQEEQSRAIQSAPDAKPSPGRLRRACVQLRQQGASAERLSAKCGPEG